MRHIYYIALLALSALQFLHAKDIMVPLNNGSFGVNPFILFDDPSMVIYDYILNDTSPMLEHKSNMIKIQEESSPYISTNNSTSILVPNIKYDYEEIEAAESVRYANAAYCVKWHRAGYSKCLIDWSCEVTKKTRNLEDVKLFHYEENNTDGYVGYCPDTNRIIVSFAGTDVFSLRNWITNLKFLSQPYKGCDECRVHTGFYTAYLNIRSKVLSLIYEIYTKHPTAVVFTTGHSLGGALATHMVLDLKINEFQITKTGTDTFITSNNADYDILTPELPQIESTDSTTITFDVSGPQYSFGAPRLGNTDFSEFFRKTLGSTGIYRLTHHRDPVPHLPPMAFFYYHPTREVFYDKNTSSFDVCSIDEGEDNTCSNQYAFTLSIADHFLYAGLSVDSDLSNC